MPCLPRRSSLAQKQKQNKQEVSRNEIREVKNTRIDAVDNFKKFKL